MAYTQDVTEVLVGDLAVYVGTAGTPATNIVGFIRQEDAVEVEDGPEPKAILVNGVDYRTRSYLTHREGTITIPSLQTNATLLGIAFGVTPNGQVVTMDSTPKLMSQISLAIVGENLAGTAYRRDWLYVSTDGMPKQSFSGRELAPLTMKFNVEGAASGVYSTFGAGNVTATISSGVLTRTGNYHKVIGEGAAADVLDTITGSSLTNGETLTLQINAVAAAITLNDQAAGPGELHLNPSADWIMTKLSDWIVLQYSTANTQWDEIARLMPSA